MITIDQLLESVDLDFEPRWVTKDKSGDITMFLHKPTPENWCEEWRGRETKYECLGRIKLAEFENKPWQECIYEVPRKITGKIEKLPFIVPEDGAIFDTVDYIRIFNEFVISVNELVDAVNKLKGAKND